MENLRRGYGFSLEDKQLVRDKANGHCLYGDGSCPNPNTGRVNHITGVFEAFLDRRDKRDISNPLMNATMECTLHEAVHDAQERFQIACLKGEKVIYQRRYGTQYTKNQRRRHR